ncbi:MAG: CheB methylesterase domain-containing protein, partial [Planctomycetota bacterium]
PRALAEILARLPADLRAPVLIVQHVPREFTASLAESLDRKGTLRVRVARDGERVERGTALLAPGDRHMKVTEAEDPGGDLRIALSDEPAENGCRPAADCLFRSLAAVRGRETLAVVLTGMGTDGLLGARLLKRKGATVFAQDPSSSVAWGMPRAIVEAGLADRVLRLEEMAAAIAASMERS